MKLFFHDDNTKLAKPHREQFRAAEPDPNGLMIPTRIIGDWWTARKFEPPKSWSR